MCPVKLPKAFCSAPNDSLRRLHILPRDEDPIKATHSCLPSAGVLILASPIPTKHRMIQTHDNCVPETPPVTFCARCFGFGRRTPVFNLSHCFRSCLAKSHDRPKSRSNPSSLRGDPSSDQMRWVQQNNENTINGRLMILSIKFVLQFPSDRQTSDGIRNPPRI
jgi:hypothetical protein